MRTDLVLNFVVFQVGWIVAVWGAARGYPLAGVVYALGFVIAHHWRMDDGRVSELLFVASSALLGYIVDSALVLTDVIVFPAHAQLGWPTTLWMVCLWVMFSMTLRYSLGWLRGRYLLAALLGALGGPLAYWAGSRLGAIELEGYGALLEIGAAWGLSMIVLLGLEAFTRPAATQRTFREMKNRL